MSSSADVESGGGGSIEVIPSDTNSITSLALFTTDTVDNLSCGFLAVLEPEIIRVKKSLNELVVNQEEMLQSIHDKRTQFEDTSFSSEILATLEKVPSYKHKLSLISKQMQTLTKRVKRLQQRSLKLKSVRLDRDVHAKEEYQKKLQQEKLLEAKPAK